jgi:predicted RNA binding protein YcfA (HicA-like mRNA interferase family)
MVSRYNQRESNQYKHSERPGRITIAGHLTDDLAPGTMNSIFKQAKIKER